jgi:hypothetical protein
MCSPVISSRVAEMCKLKDIGYLDAAGNCHIVGRNLFVHVEGRKNLQRVSREAVDLFAEKSSRVIRVLLSDPQRGWQVQRLAEEAKISLGLASRLKRKLIEQAYAELRDGLLFVRDARALLDAWAKIYKPPQLRNLYVMDEAKKIEHKIAEWCSANQSRYAFTAFAGAWRVAPMVRYSVPSMYVESPDCDLSALERQLGAKAVEDGANLQLWIPADEYVFYRMRAIDRRNVVSAIQLYLDLSALRGRGGEAAAEVFEKEILVKWQS